MTIRHLKTFILVAELGSVSKAAEELHVAQPSVSQTIKELENYYNANLFNREERKLKLTKEGLEILAKAKEVVTSFDEFEDLANNSKNKAIIDIGATMTFGTFSLPSILDLLKKEVPNGETHLYIDKIQPLEEKILKGDLDFAFIEGLPTNKNIKMDVFGEDQLIVVAGNNYPIKEKIKLSDLVKYDLLIREKGSAPRKILDNALHSKGIRIDNPKMESISNMIIISLVMKNKGVGILPYDIVKRYLDEGLIREIKTDTLLIRKLCIIHHKNKHFSSIEKKAYKLCEEFLKTTKEFYPK